MMLKTPKFWYRNHDTAAPMSERALEPLSRLYKFGYTLHQSSRTPHKAALPVLCIGNIVAGGTGKTPTALALMAVIRKNNIAKNPYFLIRGYGGGAVGPLLVDPNKHTAWETGDEALILSRAAPTVVSINRALGAELAKKQGADLVLMDDGLQNPGITKDISIVVINGDMGFGNEKILPAGPLREPLQDGIARADAFIIIGADKRDAAGKLPAGKPVFTATLKANTTKIPPKDKTYIAFAGLGYPDKFFNFLRGDIGLTLAETIRFADHYPYTRDDLEALAQKAVDAKAELLTTEKDFMRLPKIEGVNVHTLPVDLVWDDENGVAQFLQDKLASLKS